MESPILIVPLICLPTIKAAHAQDKGREAQKGKGKSPLPKSKKAKGKPGK